MQKTFVQQSENIKRCDYNIHRTVLQLFEETEKFDDLELLFNFSWGQEILTDECTLSSLTFRGLCDNIKIPVSIKSIEKLKQFSLNQPSSKKEYMLPFNPLLTRTWEINASEICGSIQQEIHLASLVACHLQLPTKLMDVKTELQRLIILEPGGQCFFSHCTSCIANNKFGTVVLQLPVEGGYEGGHLNVEYKRKKTVFENHVSSDKNSYISAFYNCCEKFMDPITKGHKLILVFDLIWTNAKTAIPNNFPVFLTALKVIKQVLKPWLHQNGANLEMLLDPYPSTREIQEKSSEGNTSVHLYSNWILKEKILFFILKENYEEKSLAFEVLRGQDKVLVEILVNCDFLDVHLAKANHIIPKIKNEEPLYVECCESENQGIGEGHLGSIEISTLIDFNDVPRNLSFELDWDKHFVGLIQSNPVKEVYSENREVKVELGKRNLHHGVLVIWPKHLSVPIYCRFGLHSLLIRMGHMNSSAKWEARQSVRSDLRQLVSFCRAEPQRAWTTSDLGRGELTLRLLRFCTSLQAFEEGFQLLKILGSDFDSENFEGIQNDQVAQAIADFVSQITVWNDVAELIKPLISRDRISKQLLPITKFAKFLQRTNCMEGATMVGNCVSFFFAELDQNHAANLKKSDIEAYMDMVVFLETNPDTCCRLRVSIFILFFYKLRPSCLLCRLLWDLKTQYRWILKSMQYFRFLLDELCESLRNLPEVSSAGNAENLSVASNPLNNKENQEEKQTISSCTPSESRSTTTFGKANEHPEFPLQINAQATTSLKIQSSVDPDSSTVACHDSGNPQVLVPFHSPRDIISNYNDFGSTPSISGGGFFLERFRDLLDPAVEEMASITGGSICSKSDYLFQLRDFESAFEEVSKATLAQADKKTGIAMYMFDPILEAEYVERSIEEGSCKLHHVDEEREFQNSPSSRLKCLNVEASEAFRNKKEKTKDNRTNFPYTPSGTILLSTPFAAKNEHPIYPLQNNSQAITSLKVQCSVSSSSTSPNVACGKFFKLKELVPHHSSWDTVSHSDYPESSPISYKGVLLERFGGLLNPAVQGETSITGGSICSVSDYLFQLRDFESSFDEITSSSVLKADLPTGYGMPVYPLAIELVRKPPPVEDHQCQTPTVDLASVATSSLKALQSEVSSEADNRKKPKITVENTSLDVETSTISRRTTPTVSNIKSYSSGAESNDSFEKAAIEYNTEKYNFVATSVIANSSRPKTTPGTNRRQPPFGINKTLETPPSHTVFWNGDINSKEIGKVNVKAVVIDPTKLIPKFILPSKLELIGRIKPEVIWDYVNQTKRAGTRGIVIISFFPTCESSRQNYSLFIHHMEQNERFAVVGPVSKLIKDFYLVPLFRDRPIPAALISFSKGIDWFQNRNYSLLLGIVIPSRKREAVQGCASVVP